MLREFFIVLKSLCDLKSLSKIFAAIALLYFLTPVDMPGKHCDYTEHACTYDFFHKSEIVQYSTNAHTSNK